MSSPASLRVPLHAPFSSPPCCTPRSPRSPHHCACCTPPPPCLCACCALQSELPGVPDVPRDTRVTDHDPGKRLGTRGGGPQLERCSRHRHSRAPPLRLRSAAPSPEGCARRGRDGATRRCVARTPQPRATRVSGGQVPFPGPGIPQVVCTSATRPDRLQREWYLVPSSGRALLCCAANRAV